MTFRVLFCTMKVFPMHPQAAFLQKFLKMPLKHTKKRPAEWRGAFYLNINKFRRLFLLKSWRSA